MLRSEGTRSHVDLGVVLERTISPTHDGYCPVAFNEKLLSWEFQKPFRTTINVFISQSLSQSLKTLEVFRRELLLETTLIVSFPE